jgi:hypothetical protein
MRNRHFESDTPRLFRAEDSLERLHTKNVIELSVLGKAQCSRICINEQRFGSESKSEIAVCDLAFV